MNVGDTFTHQGVQYKVTKVVSATEIHAIGKDNSVEYGPGALPKRIKINPANIQP